MAQWVAKACLDSGIFDDIYINSESEVFDKIAKDIGVKFYKRPEVLSTNSATNDDFALDFMNKINCDVLVQVNPTSPFTKVEDIQKLVEMFINGNYQTVHTVKEEQIEGLFKGRPLNFDPTKQMPP